MKTFILIFCLAFLLGCATTQKPLSWEEWQAQHEEHVAKEDAKSDGQLVLDDLGELFWDICNGMGKASASIHH